MNLALFLALPVLTWAGGCCIVSTTSSGTEVFRTSEGTPSETCEGQWTDMACSEFEQTYGVQSISQATQSPTGPPTPTLHPSSPANISDSVPSDPPTYAPLTIPLVISSENSTNEDPPASLSFRFADVSGCGALRSCSVCIAKEACMWSDSGCTRSIATLNQWCSPEPRADTVKQPCETFMGCNSCTSTAGCIWYRGACSYSNSAACERDPANCVNYAWNCPAEVLPVVPWVQPGYGTFPSTGSVAGAAYSTVRGGNLNTASGLAYSSAPGVPVPTNQNTPPLQSVNANSFIMGTSFPIYQPLNNRPQSGAQQSSGFYPPPPELPSQLAVIGPLVSQANVGTSTIPPTSSSASLYVVAGPSPPGSGGLYSSPPSTQSSSGGMYSQPSGLYPDAILSSQSTANAPLRSPTPRPTPPLSSQSRSDSPLKLPDPLPNRAQSAIIGQYDVVPPTPTVLYQPPLIDYQDFDQPTPAPTPKSPTQTSQLNSQPPQTQQGQQFQPPRTQQGQQFQPPQTQQGQQFQPPQAQQFQPNLYLPTNYAPFPSSQFGFGTLPGSQFPGQVGGFPG